MGYLLLMPGFLEAGVLGLWLITVYWHGISFKRSCTNLATSEALCMLVLEMCQQGKGMDISIREI